MQLTVAAFSVRQPPPNALGFLFSQTQLSTDSAKVLRAGHTKARQAYPDDPDIAKKLGILNYRRASG
jgi:hypothetical protein